MPGAKGQDQVVSRVDSRRASTSSSLSSTSTSPSSTSTTVSVEVEKKEEAREDTKGKGKKEEAKGKKEDGKEEAKDKKEDGKEKTTKAVSVQSKMGAATKVVMMTKKKAKNELKVPKASLVMTPVRGQKKNKFKKALLKKKTEEKETVAVISEVEEETVEAEEEATEDVEGPDPPGILIDGTKLNPLDDKCAELIRKDPERDCRKYNWKKRASELFEALDADSNGFVDDDEFVEGDKFRLRFMVRIIVRKKKKMFSITKLLSISVLPTLIFRSISCPEQLLNNLPCAILTG